MTAAVLRFLVTMAAIPLCGHYMDGVTITDYTQALIMGAVLGIIYLLLRPLARLVLSVFNFCTLGLLNIAVDAWLVWTAAYFFEGSVLFESFWWALAVAVIINALRTVIGIFTGDFKH